MCVCVSLAVKMTQWVRVRTTKMDNLSLSQRAMWCKERTYSHELPSDLLMRAVTHTCSPLRINKQLHIDTHTQREPELFCV